MGSPGEVVYCGGSGYSHWGNWIFPLGCLNFDTCHSRHALPAPASDSTHEKLIKPPRARESIKPLRARESIEPPRARESIVKLASSAGELIVKSASARKGTTSMLWQALPAVPALSASAIDKIQAPQWEYLPPIPLAGTDHVSRSESGVLR